MRTALVIGFSALAFMSSLGPSEARFKLRLTGHSVGAHRTQALPALAVLPAPSVQAPRAGRMAAAAVAVPLGVQTAEALAPDEVGAIGLPQRSAPVAAPALRKEASAWCPTGRVSGSGSGFCIIN